MTQDKVDTACDQLTEEIRKNVWYYTRNASRPRGFLTKHGKLLSRDKLRNKIYAREGAAAERFKDAVHEANPDNLYRDIWLPVGKAFSRRSCKWAAAKWKRPLKWLLATEKGEAAHSCRRCIQRASSGPLLE